MMVRGKAAVVVEVVVVVVAVAVEGRKLWQAICLRENLIVLIIAVVAIVVTVVIQALLAIVECLVTVSPQL